MSYVQIVCIIFIVVALCSYLIGSVNFSIILSRLLSGKDIRESGSGNAGATNMLRTYGKKMGIITLLLDILKGVVVVFVVKFYANQYHYFLNNIASSEPHYIELRIRFLKDMLSLSYIAGVCVVLGHNFPVYFGFKGGKGVATSLGVVLMLDWKIGLIVLAAAILLMAITRYVSLGSIVGGTLFIILEVVKMIITHDFNVVVLVCSIVLGGLLIVRHHANIKRLLSGTENKLGSKGGNK